MFVLFIVGELLSSVIVIIAKADDYASMGMLFSTYFGGMLLFLLTNSKFSTGFELAVKMSVSRKNYIVGAIGAAFIIYICFFLAVNIFYYVDKLYVRLAFGDIPYELDFVNKMNIASIILISFAALSISVFVGALIERFGKNLYPIILFIGAFIGIFAYKFLIHIKGLSVIEDKEISNLFYKIFLSIYQVFDTIPLAKLGIVFVVCTLCLSVGISMLKKQAIVN
jgi:hypothetical protein